VRLHSRDLSKILIISQYQHFPQICCFLRFLWSKPRPGRAPHISVTAPFVDKHGESTCDWSAIVDHGLEYPCACAVYNVSAVVWLSPVRWTVEKKF
jgi:hypothetical protein